MNVKSTSVNDHNNSNDYEKMIMTMRNLRVDVSLCVFVKRVSMKGL